MELKTNFLIIGSGIAGLNFALNASKKGKVIIITKKKLIDSNTNFAQGGIAAVLNKTDNFNQHIKDTLKTGSFHNNRKSVEFMVKNGPKAIKKLINLGIQFEKSKNQLKFTQEGGHKNKRIIYIGDHTGQEIEKTLIQKIKNNPNIDIYENTFALDLITKNKICYGSFMINKNKISTIYANQTILATGGIGELYKYTTNPLIATGDGIAMAKRAKCKIKDMEFIQFHPTAFAKKLSPMFLISETVRGEGGILINNKKERFMKDIHPLKDLAPRDIIAKEIYKQSKTGKVYLDISHKKENFIKKRFPHIYKTLKKYNYDLTKQKIPVTPATHYLCGGICTNLNGESSIKNLFSFGETAQTGVHGANRLASNSLLEALVFSNQIIKNLEKKEIKSIKLNKKFIYKKNKKTLTPIKKTIKEIMWEYGGINRDIKKIKKYGIPKLEKIHEKLKKIKYTNEEITEVKNMIEVGLLILKSASKRKKSLGCHFTN